jgi:L-asparaginase II
MPFAALVQNTRGPLAEMVHSGAVAVVDYTGALQASVGDPYTMAFTRSTLKPFQALPFLQGGGLQHFGFSAEQTALLCASHNGEDMHIAQIDGMLRKVGHTHRSLQCGCHVPLRFSYGGLTPPADLQYDERHHNCSGKHTGFIAFCVQHGLSLDNHLAPEHPLQVAIHQAIMRVARCEASSLVAGTDGCSAPNYAMPLSKLALCFARLASSAQDTEFGEHFSPLASAMGQHPEMVSGTGRNDLAFTQAGRGDWITKIGADGVQVIASICRRKAIAIKVISGHMPALYAAAVETMEQLGWLDARQRTLLEPWRHQTLRNARGIAVGIVQPCFQLERVA